MIERLSGLRGVLLVALASLTLFSFLGDARLWDRDEPRNAQAAHEMLERNDWIVPTFNGELRSHKPVMLYWLQMISYQTLGQSEFTARLPSALLGIASVLAISLLSSRLAGEGRGIGPTGFWTGATLATSLLFVMAGRAATPDSCLIAFSTIGISCLVIAIIKPNDDRSLLARSILRTHVSWLGGLLGYLMLGGAILSKGPVGLILPMVILHIWWMVVSAPERRTQRKNRIRDRLTRLWDIFHPAQCLQAIMALRSIPGCLIALAVAAPWYIAVGLATDGEFLSDFFWRHNVGRAMSSMEGHNGSILFYPAALLVGTFPWSLWLLPILWWGSRAYRRGPATRTSVSLAVTWVTVTVVAFSCASTKLPSYITSCYPGAAILIGGFLKDFAADVRMPSRPWRTLASSIAVLLSICIASGLIWISKAEGLPMVRWVSASGLALATAGIASWIVDWNSRPRWVPAIWLSTAVVLHVGLFGIGSRAVDRYRSEVDLLVRWDNEEPSVSWYGIGGIEPSWVYYLDRPIVSVSEELQKQPTTLDFWNEFLVARGAKQGDRLIAEGAYAAKLSEASRNWSQASPLREVARTKRFLKDGEVVLFEINVPRTTQVAEVPSVMNGQKQR